MRKTRQWTLLSEEEIDLMWIATTDLRHSTIQKRRNFINKYLRQQIHLEQLERFKLVNERKKKSYLHIPLIIPRLLHETKEEISTYVMKKSFRVIFIRDFPLVREMLLQFNGRLIAAGGSIWKSIGNDGPSLDPNCDVDLFMIDPTIDHQSPLNDCCRRADDLLIDAISYLTTKWLAMSDNHKVTLRHGKFVSTLFLSGHRGETDYRPLKYQFIKRIYPSIASVIGGFDLGPAMIAYDGHELLATELGAYCSMGRVQIVDISRASTSWEHRIGKYARYCHTVFPGISESQFPPMIKEWVSPNDILDIVMLKFAEYDIVTVVDREELIIEFAVKMDDLNVELYNIADIVDDIINDVFSAGYLINFNEDNLITIQARNPMMKVGDRLMINFVESVDRQDVVKSWNIRPIFNGAEYTKMRSCDYSLGYHPIYNYDILTVNFTDPELERDFINRRSDYDNNSSSIATYDSIDLSYFKLDSLEAICSTLTFEKRMSEKEVKAKILDLWEHPSLKHILRAFDDQTRKLSSKLGDLTDVRSLYDAFSLLHGRPMKEEETTIFSNFELIANTRRKEIKSGMKTIQNGLLGNHWITVNPQRQWTSAINPLIQDPHEWYGPLYRSFRIGKIEIENTMRLAFRRKNNFFSLLPRDVFNIILREVMWLNTK